MRALVQRVRHASVTVEGEVAGRIGPGLCVLVGVTHDDDERTAARLAAKVWTLRILDDGAGRMQRSLADVAGTRPAEVLAVSQFTLYGDTTRGRRPSWSAAAPPGRAEPLVAAFCHELRRLGADVATGRFGAAMLVELANDGPVTLLLEA